MNLKRVRITLEAVFCLLGFSVSAWGWGFQGHRLVTEQAIRMVPSPLRTFFQANSRYIREHSIDPDLWRQAGREPDANHFFEIDTWDNTHKNPLPTEEATFLKMSEGQGFAKGRLPWRIMEIYQDLVEQMRKSNWAGARLQAAVLGHYVADAYVPFHATRNYDGQLTGNTGIHARWETYLVERFEQQIRQRLQTHQIVNVRPTFEVLVGILREGLNASRQILENDSRSVGGQIDYWETAYDERFSNSYYSRFYALEETDLINRIELSATRIAEAWYAAWVDAGRPSIPETVKDYLVRGDHRLLLLSWDGTPPGLLENYLSNGRLLNLKGLLSKAAYSSKVSTSLPSLTAPGHAAIWTGAWGNRNGITANQVPFPPSPEKSVLDYASGFSSTPLQLEPLWMTAARQGLETLVLQAIQVFPFEPFTNGKRFGGDQSRRLTLFDGYSSEISMNNLIGPDVKFQTPGGWEGLPPTHGQGKEFSFQISHATLYGFVFDSPEDPVAGYDSLIVTPDKADKRRFLLLKPAEAPDYARVLVGAAPSEARTWDRFGPPLWISVDGERLPAYFRLFQLDNSQGRFLLYHSWVYRRASSRSELAKPFQERTGGFWGHAGIHLYRHGLLGTPIMNGGKGEAERRYLETVALSLRQYAEATTFALRQMKWDLLINYVPLPDEVCHSWFGWTDHSSPAYSEQQAKALAPYLEAAFIMQDHALGKILESLPANSAVALVSDHGVQGIGKDFLPNVVLKRAGLLALRPDGGVDLAKTKIYAASEGTLLLVNSRNRKGGIVDDTEKPEVLRLAEKALLAVRDPETGQSVVVRVIDPLRRTEVSGLGGPSGGNLYFELARGYAPQNGVSGEPVTVRQFPTGNHSLDPDGTLTGFLFSGPGLRRCRNLGPVRLIDLAPTFCKYLGIEPPAGAEGKILEEVFE